MANILVVDDEIEIVELLKIYLTNYGYQVLEAYDSEAALNIIDHNEIDAAILDIMLPKVNGFGLLVKIREEHNFPIMFLSARGEDMDKISGLGLGADDYMVKPFNPLEVIARIQALLRRSSKINTDSTENDNNGFLMKFGDLTLNTEACELTKKGKLVQLTSMEYKLLLFFLDNPNRVFTKQQLYDKVWGEEYLSDDNIIMVYISKLREKIEDNPKEPRFIKTIRGLGYRLERK